MADSGYVVGLGFAYLCDRDATLMIFGGTPLDRDTVHVRMAVASHAEQVATLLPDFTIRERKLHLERLTLCDADGPVPEFPRWASRFYPTQGQAAGSSNT